MFADIEMAEMNKSHADKLIAMPGAILRFNASLMGGADGVAEMVVPTFLIEHPKGLVLFDTGCNLRAAEDAMGYLGDITKMLQLEFPRDRVVDQQLRHHGYQPSQVDYVILSHGHFDHAGGLALFPKARCFVMKGELSYALSPEGEKPGFMAEDFTPARSFNWTEPTGDHDLFGDGTITMLNTPGHTPGECSLMVRLKSQTVILTGDTLHFREQIETLEGLSSDFDPARAAESVKRLVEMERRGEGRLWINHAPEDWAANPHQLE